MRSIRQCYVCSLPVPQDDATTQWEVINVDGRVQYRCPRHRVKPRLATIGDAIQYRQKAKQ